MRQRRHACQFTEHEAELAEAVRRKVLAAPKSIAKHCRARMSQRGTDPHGLAECLRHGEPFELAQVYGEWRVGLRHEYNGTAHCTVWTETGTAMAYWLNRANDRHETLDLSKYASQPIA